MRFTLFFLPIFAAAHGDKNLRTKSQCGKPTDPCMTEENWNQCRKFEENGCQQVAVMESCPLQFQCGDLLNSNKGSPPGEPTACVSLDVYHDDKCKDGPVRTISFPTWTQSGSICYHDATMDSYSVEDEYCNLETGNWHEKVYPGTETCEVNWMSKWWSPMELTFTTDSCIDGFMLNSCKNAPCKSEEYYEIEEKEVAEKVFDSAVVDHE